MVMSDRFVLFLEYWCRRYGSALYDLTAHIAQTDPTDKYPDYATQTAGEPERKSQGWIESEASKQEN